MVQLRPPLRLATEADLPALAVLNSEASRGLAFHAWRQMAGPGGDPWSVGVGRHAARVRDRRWVVVDEGAGPVAGLLAWPTLVVPPAPDLAAIFRPVVELEALVPDGLFINTLATLAEARGRGFGTSLLRVADDIARAEGRPRLSLTVADSNAGARRLYARAGFVPLASLPMVKDGWDGEGSAWILMVRDLPTDQEGPGFA
ncbi:MAG: GNAT family N-acetyltransferase [Amaricoccus sp.]